MFIFTLLILNAHAEIFNPPDLCAPPLDCEPTMARLNKEFQDSKEVLTTADVPALYSGVCYHRSPWNDPKRTEHGFMFTDLFQNQVYMDGQFVFGPDQDPYKDYSMEDAKKAVYGDPHDPKKLVSLGKDFAYSDMNPDMKGNQPMLYWAKKGSNNSLLMIGQWGYSQVLVCKMEKHK